MAVRWSIAAFDWTRFGAIRASLREAVETRDFTRIDDADAREILSQVSGESAAEEIANLLFTELCTSEEILFDTGLPALLLRLRRQPHGEEPSELIGELISAGPNVEAWYQCEGGLAGILGPEETRELAAELAEFRKRDRGQPERRSAGVISRYFKTSDTAREHLDDLMSLVDEAAARGQGLAAIAEA